MAALGASPCPCCRRRFFHLLELHGADRPSYIEIEPNWLDDAANASHLRLCEVGV